jgi:hypothetical protein
MPQTDTRQNLIQEGLSSYLDAMVAIEEFTRVIQKDCRTILETHVPRLEKASGLKFNTKEIADDSEPYKSRGRTWSGQSASIGAVLPVKNSDRFYSFDTGICWNHENGNRSVCCYSDFYTKTTSVLDELAMRFDALYPGKFEVDRSWWALVRYRENSVRVQGDYQVSLDKLVNEWIDAWERVGGVTGLLAKGRK